MVLFAADFCFEEGKGGTSLKQSGCEGDQSSGNKTIKLSCDKSVGHLLHLPIDVKDFFNVKFAFCKLFNRLSLWRRADTRNVSLLTHYGGQFTFSTQFFNTKLPANQKKGWLIHLNGTWLYNYIFYLVESAELDRFALSIKPLNLPLTLWYKFRYRFPEIFTFKNFISECPT